MIQIATFDFDIDQKRLMRAMETDDHIGALLRVHFELDRVLQHIVERSYVNHSALGLNYTGQKINALSAIGVPAERLEPARIINNIRNSFAHKEGREEFSGEDIGRLKSAIVALTNKPFLDWKITMHSKTKPTFEHTFSKMSVKEQFCLIGFVAIGLIAELSSVKSIE